MNHIVAFSGGLASAVVADIVVSDPVLSNVILLFHDTRSEPNDNYRFRGELSSHWDIPITEQSDGRDIWELFRDEGYLGNGRNAMCSRVLKRELAYKFVKENKPCIIYFGFTPDEWNRAQRVYSRYQQIGVEARFPLIDKKILKSGCKKIVKGWGIRPPAMYCYFGHANCMPCIKGKLKYWGLVYKYEREAWERARQAEIEHDQTILTDSGNLEEALPDCLRVAKLNDKQESLFELPCDCMG